MMLPAALLVLAAGCAFVMGYSVNQASICAVNAAKELIDHRHGTMLTGFAVAVGTAGLICLPLSWVLGGAGHLTMGGAIGWPLVIGAVMLGLGAVINDACLLGTLSRIGHGEARFLALPIGLGIGFALADRQSWLTAGMAAPNPFAAPSPAAYAVVLGFALLLVGALRALKYAARPGKIGHWPIRRAMLLLGLCGALLFAVTPGWTNADAVHHAVGRGGVGVMAGLGALLAVAAALAGALVSGFRARSFHWQRPTVAAASRSIAGGAIMAFGATLVPGGNDTLLLASVPAATLSGLTAHAIMSITAPLLLIALRASQSR